MYCLQYYRMMRHLKLTQQATFKAKVIDYTQTGIPMTSAELTDIIQLIVKYRSA